MFHRPFPFGSPPLPLSFFKQAAFLTERIRPRCGYSKFFRSSLALITSPPLVAHRLSCLALRYFACKAAPPLWFERSTGKTIPPLSSFRRSLPLPFRDPETFPRPPSSATSRLLLLGPLTGSKGGAAFPFLPQSPHRRASITCWEPRFFPGSFFFFSRG